jgi:hypothetical protein
MALDAGFFLSQRLRTHYLASLRGFEFAVRSSSDIRAERGLLSRAQMCGPQVDQTSLFHIILPLGKNKKAAFIRPTPDNSGFLYLGVADPDYVRAIWFCLTRTEEGVGE